MENLPRLLLAWNPSMGRGWQLLQMVPGYFSNLFPHPLPMLPLLRPTVILLPVPQGLCSSFPHLPQYAGHLIPMATFFISWLIVPPSLSQDALNVLSQLTALSSKLLSTHRGLRERERTGVQERYNEFQTSLEKEWEDWVIGYNTSETAPLAVSALYSVRGAPEVLKSLLYIFPIIPGGLM